MNKIYLLTLLLLLQHSMINAQWQQTSLTSEYVTCFESDGVNFFAGTSSYGFYLSTDNGTNWIPKNNGLTNVTINALTVSGTNIFAGTNGGGIFLSNDTGSNWIAVNNGLTNLQVNTLAALGTNIYAGTGSGIFLSTDTGNSWIPANAGLADSTVWTIEILGTKIFAGTNSGIYLSSDSGALWTNINNGVTNSAIKVIAVSDSLIAASPGNDSLFISGDNGNTWSSLGSSSWFMGIRSLAVKGIHIFISYPTSGVYYSSNNGGTWFDAGSNSYIMACQALAIFGNLIFAGEQGSGVWKRLISPLTETFDFSISSNDGCSPLDVTFTNLTTDTNAYLYQWAFVGPASSDTLFIWDTLTTTFTYTFNFSAPDTGMGKIKVLMTAYDSSGSYLKNNGYYQEIDIHLSMINSTISPDTCTAGVGSVSITGCCGNAPYSYQWFNGSTSAAITGLTAGTYNVTMTDGWGCNIIDSFTVGTSSYTTPASICIVSVDSALNKNKIIWDEVSDLRVFSYNIYKETNQAGIYSIIGNQPVSSLSTFIDTSSNPSQIAARYKISAVDSCDNESAISAAHKTIHLSISLGIPPAINLNWDHYEGINYAEYYIWRGSGGNLTLIDIIQSSLTSYTDLNPPAGTNIYVIQVVYLPGCNPTIKNSVAYSSSFSNMVSSSLTEIQETESISDISILPNPTDGIGTINSYDGISGIEIYNLLGERIYQEMFSGYPISVNFNITDMPRGIYLMRVQSRNNSISKKIIRD